MHDVKSRLKHFIANKGLSVKAFEQSIDVGNGYVNNISKSIGVDNINTIIEKYTNLNIDWLLTGRGSMLREVGKSGEGRTTPAYPEEGKDADVIGRLQRRVAELEEDKRRLQREVDSLHEMLAGYKKNGLASSDTVQKKSVG